MLHFPVVTPAKEAVKHGVHRLLQPIEALLRESADVFSGRDTLRGCLLVLSAINCTPAGKNIQEHMSEYRVQMLGSIRQRLDEGWAQV